MKQNRQALIFFAAVALGLCIILVLRAGIQQWVYRPLCGQYLSVIEGEDAGCFAFRSFESSIRPARYECTFVQRKNQQIALYVVQDHETGRAAMMIASVAEVISYVVIYGLILSIGLGYASR